MEMPGIEPGASYMQSMRSTTELHPLWVSFKNTGWRFLDIESNFCKTYYMETPGIEPGASRMLSARSTTELRPRCMV